MSADMKLYKEDFSLPECYHTTEIRKECEATSASTGGPLTCSNALIDAPWTCTTRKYCDYVAYVKAARLVSPLMRIPGFHTFNLFEDALHIDALGLRLDAAAGCAVQMVSEGIFGEIPSSGSWKRKLNIPLAQATLRFRHHCRFNGIAWQKTSKFTTNFFSMYVKDDYPVMKGKARNCVDVTNRPHYESQQHLTTEPQKMRATMLWGFKELWDIMSDSRPRVRLTVSELGRLSKTREAILLCYHWLHKDAAAQGRRQFNLRPKFHYLDHLLRRSLRTQVSPGVFWTFAAESFIGMFARQCQRVHGASLYRRAVSRWIIYFWVTIVEFNEKHASTWESFKHLLPKTKDRKRKRC